MPDFQSAEAAAAIIAGVISLLTAIATAAVTVLVTNKQLTEQRKQADEQLRLSEQRLREESRKALAENRLTEERFRREFQLDFAAERVARELLLDQHWCLRSFEVIKHHLSGFADDELRKVLVRSGAIRFDSKSGKELWGLLERNRELLGVERIGEDPGEREVEAAEGGRVIQTQEFKF